MCRASIALRSLVLTVPLLCLAPFGWSDEEKGRNKGADSHSIVRDNVKKWKILLTVQGGGGLEAKRFGWHSLQVDFDGNTTIRKHAGFQGNINVFDENAIAHSKAKVIFPEFHNRRATNTRVSWRCRRNQQLRPAANTRTPNRGRLAAHTEDDRDRREISVAAKELQSIAGAGEDFLRLLEAINKIVPLQTRGKARVSCMVSGICER